MPEWSSLLTDAALKSSALLILALAAARLMQRRSAGARHLVWTAAASAVLALPFLACSLPVLHVPAADRLAALAPSITFRADANADPATATSVPAAAPRPALTARVFWRQNAAAYITLTWAAGAFLSVGQLLLAAFLLARRRNQAPEHPQAAEARTLARAFRIEHPVEILEAPADSMPLACGLLRPAIFLPANAAEWSAQRREMVMLHELAHVRRGDIATQLIARLALSLYWWNPLAWMAWREFLKERERAADDLVLLAGTRASDYAGHLLEIARAMQPSRSLASSAVAMARRSQLEGRLLAILDSRRNRRAAPRVSVLAAAAAAVVLVAPFAAMRAQDAAPSAKPAQDLVKLGDLARKEHRDADAAAIYTQAIAALGTDPAIAKPLMSRGILLFSQKKYEEAEQDFQRAQAADPAHAVRPLAWLGLAESKQEAHAAAAESYFRQAITAAPQHSTDTAMATDLYAYFLRQQQRFTEAEDMRQQAQALRKELAAPYLRTPGPGVFRMGGGIAAPKLIAKKEPSYTEEARVAKYQGTVILYVEVAPDGLAHNIQVVQAIGMGLDEEAVSAVSQWRFEPGTKDGIPVPVAATIEVNFRLL